MSVATRFYLDGGDITIERIQDVEPILDVNKSSHLLGKQRGDMRKIASIPMVLIEKWMTEEGAPLMAMDKKSFDQFIRKKINDPDNRFLRTDGGV